LGEIDRLAAARVTDTKRISILRHGFKMAFEYLTEAEKLTAGTDIP